MFLHDFDSSREISAKHKNLLHFRAILEILVDLFSILRRTNDVNSGGLAKVYILSSFLKRCELLSLKRFKKCRYVVLVLVVQNVLVDPSILLFLVKRRPDLLGGSQQEILCLGAFGFLLLLGTERFRPFLAHLYYKIV